MYNARFGILSKLILNVTVSYKDLHLFNFFMRYPALLLNSYTENTKLEISDQSHTHIHCLATCPVVSTFDPQCYYYYFSLKTSRFVTVSVKVRTPFFQPICDFFNSLGMTFTYKLNRKISHLNFAYFLAAFFVNRPYQYFQILPISSINLHRS